MEKGKNKIAIVEILNHPGFLRDVCKIANSKPNEVTVFTTIDLFSEIRDKLNVKDYKWFVKKEDESKMSFLRRTEAICNDSKIDLVVINTIQGNFMDRINFLFFNPKCKKILTIHNLNFWLNRNDYFSFNILLTIKSNLIRIILKILLKRYYAINVVASPLKEYVEENTNWKRPVFTIPFFIYSSDSEEEIKTEKLKIAITGHVIKRRKDYETVISALDTISPKLIAEIELFILGKPDSYGENVIKKFKNMKGLNLIYFNKRVPEEEFSNYLKKSDIIIVPTTKEVKVRICREIYGTTKATGGIFDAIKYGKPFIIPEYHKTPTELKGSYLKYGNSLDLKNIIESLLKDKNNLKRLKKMAKENSDKFSLEKMQNYFQEVVLSHIKNN